MYLDSNKYSLPLTRNQHPSWWPVIFSPLCEYNIPTMSLRRRSSERETLIEVVWVCHSLWPPVAISTLRITWCWTIVASILGRLRRCRRRLLSDVGWRGTHILPRHLALLVLGPLFLQPTYGFVGPVREDSAHKRSSGTNGRHHSLLRKRDSEHGRWRQQILERDLDWSS